MVQDRQVFRDRVGFRLEHRDRFRIEQGSGESRALDRAEFRIKQGLG